MMNLKHPQLNAGFRICRRTGAGKGWVTVYYAAEARVDVGDDPWAVVCETHGTMVGCPTRPAAESTMRSGGHEFCDECRAVKESV